MNARFILLAGSFAALVGCQLFQRVKDHRDPPPPPPPITYSQYHLDSYSWDRVGRVLVLPMLNESSYTRADEEIFAALTSELQKLGRFEVIAAPRDDAAGLSTCVHRDGRFDEGILLDIARETRADVVVHGTITHYSPYPRPRLGLILQAVSPQEAKVVASVDGMWDTMDRGTAEQVRAFYRQAPKLPPRIRNNVIAADDSFAADLALDSPALFQRFVCHISAEVLIGLTADGTPGQPAGGLGGGGPTCCPPPVGRPLFPR